MFNITLKLDEPIFIYSLEFSLRFKTININIFDVKEANFYVNYNDTVSLRAMDIYCKEMNCHPQCPVLSTKTDSYKKHPRHEYIIGSTYISYNLNYFKRRVKNFHFSNEKREMYLFTVYIKFSDI